MSEVVKAQIEIIDPCLDPKGIVAPVQINPAAYFYEDEPAVFTLTQFESVPPGCAITYNCLETDSTDVECTIPDVTTFDE